MQKISNFFKNLGPGIIAASAAIGTSHLIQSTRAGGYFGFELLWLVILTNILKYPFIEYGFRYTAGAKENLLQGYNKLSKKLLIIFIILNIIASIGAIAAVSYISAGIFKSITNINLDLKLISLLIISFCWLIITTGHYKYLDKIMKILMTILLISTIIALFFAIKNYQPATDIFYNQSAWDWKYVPFIIALMGWMPGPIELSVWYSLWLESRNKMQKANLSFKKTRIDFNVGYFLMIITAIFFVCLGALVLHNSDQEISSNGVIFTSQFLSTYTSTIGIWSKEIIYIAILAAIFSTTLAVIDVYPRSVAEAIMIIREKGEEEKLKIARNFRLFYMSLLCFIAFLIIYFFVNNFKTLIDIVTIIAFFSAPLFAYMNYKLVTSDKLPKKYQPKKWLRILTYIGFAYMTFFCTLFFILKIL